MYYDLVLGLFIGREGHRRVGSCEVTVLKVLGLGEAISFSRHDADLFVASRKLIVLVNMIQDMQLRNRREVIFRANKVGVFAVVSVRSVQLSHDAAVVRLLDKVVHLFELDSNLVHWKAIAIHELTAQPAVFAVAGAQLAQLSFEVHLSLLLLRFPVRDVIQYMGTSFFIQREMASRL